MTKITTPREELLQVAREFSRERGIRLRRCDPNKIKCQDDLLSHSRKTPGTFAYSGGSLDKLQIQYKERGTRAGSHRVMFVQDGIHYLYAEHNPKNLFENFLIYAESKRIREARRCNHRIFGRYLAYEADNPAIYATRMSLSIPSFEEGKESLEAVLEALFPKGEKK